MTDINTLNAIAQERARIREAIVKLSDESGVLASDVLSDHHRVFIPREEVLRIIRNEQSNHERTT